MSETIFKDRIAVITGAGGTLCSAAARELARQGAKVALLGRTRANVEAVADEIRATGAVALPLAVDVTDAAAVAEAGRAVTRQLGPCDFLINGAGGNQMEAITTVSEFVPEELNETRPEDLRGFFNLDPGRYLDVLDVNVMGTVIPCQVFGREMARQGRGAIVNFASMTSYRPLTRVPAYSMAKAGVAIFTQWLAAYLAPAGIRVNAVAPGFFLNGRNSKRLMDEGGGLTERGRNIIDNTPLKRFGQPRDLLGCMMWLLDEERAGFVTGITVSVDGGFLASSSV